MVMEFSDSVMDLDSHQINSSQLKQFVQVSDLLGITMVGLYCHVA